MVLLFPAMGLILWVAVLLTVLVLCGIIWLFCQTMLWLTDVKDLLIRRNNPAPPHRNVRSAPSRTAPTRNVQPARPAPARNPAAIEVTPDLIPKWTAAHRHYVDRDLAYWQEQFDALNSRKM